MSETRMWFKKPMDAFRRAIDEGRLSEDPAAENYAGFYMYMGSIDDRDYFKHAETRLYLPLLTNTLH